MRPSVLLGVLCAIGVIGSPIGERAYETDLVIVTITVTDQYGYPESTQIPYDVKAEYAGSSEVPSSSHHHKGHHHNAPTSTSSCPPSSTPESSLPTTNNNMVAPLPSTTTTSTVPGSYSAPPKNNQPAVSSAASAAAPAPTDSSYQGKVLYHHNIHRANHSASDLTWNSELENCAQILASRCVYKHDTSIQPTTGSVNGYGQNIGYGISAGNIGALLTDMMYNDEMMNFQSYYGQDNPDMSNFDGWGHFSQIVWQGTTSVGCATVVCPTLGNAGSDEALPFTVCNYGPPGNYAGEYAKNVAKPEKKPYISV